jgi:hypothetical protein
MHTWHAVDLLTGKRGPQLQMGQRGRVSRILGEPTDSQNTVLCWDEERGQETPEWRNWTTPGRMMTVLVDPDDRPIWGGVILRRVTDETEWVSIAMSTLEHYLDRRYSGNLSFTNVEQSTIAATLAGAAVANGGVPFTIDAKPSGITRVRKYLDSEDKTVLSLMADLMNVDNGVEFTVDLDWVDPGHTTLGYFLRIAAHIGAQNDLPVRFDHPGPVQRFSVTEDYTRENGANDVLAVSSGEGNARPQSIHWEDSSSLGSGWVRYERRWTPSTSIVSQNVLDDHAIRELRRVRKGLNEISLIADLDTCPRLNADWWLGDDIRATITSLAFPERRTADGVLRPGYERIVRVVGWEMDLDARTLTPSLREY